MLTVVQIDQILPQTQCTLCGYPGCRPYAEAILNGEGINRCVPGGNEIIAQLAALTGQPIAPLNPQCGQTGLQRLVAFIREPECIGCTKCIQACPVDAIVGAAEWMHTIISDDCTGCGLCVPPCPVDCIDMPDSGKPRLPSVAEATYWRQLHQKHLRRLHPAPSPGTNAALISSNHAQRTIAAALARTQLKKFLRFNPEPADTVAYPIWLAEKDRLEAAVRLYEQDQQP